jgi:chaperonin cofactor prefoldin
MYDKVNVKEKEFSAKITEIYQLKTQMKEQDKIIEGLKLKVATIEKEKLELKNNTSNKDQADLCKSLNDEKNILQQEFNETKEELETSR